MVGITHKPHILGLKTEKHFAHYLHYQTDEIVILWGDGVGTHGADIISVNSKTGRVTLWDTKWRTNPTMIGPSKTFSKFRTMENAKDQARRAIAVSDHLPPELIQKAVKSIDDKTFGAHTPGDGAARSSGIQFIHPEPTQ